MTDSRARGPQAEIKPLSLIWHCLVRICMPHRQKVCRCAAQQPQRQKCHAVLHSVNL